MAWIEEHWAPIVLSSFASSSRGFVVAEGDVDWLSGTRRFMSAASDKANLGLRVALAIAMSAPLWLLFRFRTLRSLSPEERSVVMERLLAHRIFFVRELTLLLKLVACMAIFRSPDARARTTYDAPPVTVTATRGRALPVLAAGHDDNAAGAARWEVA